MIEYMTENEELIDIPNVIGKIDPLKLDYSQKESLPTTPTAGTNTGYRIYTASKRGIFFFRLYNGNNTVALKMYISVNNAANINYMYRPANYSSSSPYFNATSWVPLAKGDKIRVSVSPNTGTIQAWFVPFVVQYE